MKDWIVPDNRLNTIAISVCSLDLFKAFLPVCVPLI